MSIYLEKDTMEELERCVAKTDGWKNPRGLRPHTTAREGVEDPAQIAKGGESTMKNEITVVAGPTEEVRHIGANKSTGITMATIKSERFSWPPRPDECRQCPNSPGTDSTLREDFRHILNSFELVYLVRPPRGGWLHRGPRLRVACIDQPVVLGTYN
jgi:hypothetical protein